MTAVGFEPATFRFAVGSIIHRTTASIRSRRRSLFFHLPTFSVTKVTVFERIGMKNRSFFVHFSSVTLEFLEWFREKNAEKSTFFRVFSRNHSRNRAWHLMRTFKSPNKTVDLCGRTDGETNTPKLVYGDTFFYRIHSLLKRVYTYCKLLLLFNFITSLCQHPFPSM